MPGPPGAQGAPAGTGARWVSVLLTNLGSSAVHRPVAHVGPSTPPHVRPLSPTRRAADRPAVPAGGTPATWGRGVPFGRARDRAGAAARLGQGSGSPDGALGERATAEVPASALEEPARGVSG